MILRGATCVTLDSHGRVFEADLRIDPEGNLDDFLPRGRVVAGEEEIDLGGCVVTPGLIQTHVHLCQSLMRGMAERLPLRAWLSERIWPLEAAHDPASVRASARLGLLELLTGGTTAILDMGTAHHLIVILDECARSGIRAICGSSLMDQGPGLPEPLRRGAADVIDETRRLLPRFHFADGGRVGLCMAPRFLPAVSDPAWKEIAAFAAEADLLIHTHACETRQEAEEVRERTGATPFVHLERLGVASPRLRAAHGVWLSDEDRGALARSGAGIVHCPGSNTKLGSGVADVARLWADGVTVGIGCDGAACNNRLDVWEELRRAAGAIALLHGPKEADPARVLGMAALDGARLLGLDGRIGSLEPGKAADLVVLRPEAGTGLWEAGIDPHARVLYGAGREHVEQVWIQGEIVAEHGTARRLPAATVMQQATEAARAIMRRAEA